MHWRGAPMSMQMLNSYNTFLAFLALVTGGVGVCVLVVSPLRRRLRELFTSREMLGFAAVIAAVATAGSLTYSEVVGFVPCFMCWLQRGAMYPLVLVAGYAAFRAGRKPEGMAWLSVLALAVVGLGFSTWHYLEQTFPSLSTGACVVGVPCASKYVNKFGFVSIPFMAGCGFIGIIALAVTARGRPISTHTDTDAAPASVAN
jgi:disulfide bond formation protein DsbB